MSPINLNLTLTLGSVGGGSLSETAIFTVTGSDTGTKRFNVSASTFLRVTGATVFNSASINGGVNVTAADGWVAVPVAGSYHTFTCSGNGTIELQDKRLVNYLFLGNTGTSITGTITGMALTYLYLSGTGASITGSITGMALTYLLLGVTGSAITGSITGSPLTYLYLIGTGSAINYGAGNTLNINTATGIQLLGTTVFSADGYRRLLIDAAAGTWTAGAKPLTITGGTSPGYNDGETPPQLKTAYDTIVAKGNVTITLPAGWKGGAYPNDFPA